MMMDTAPQPEGNAGKLISDKEMSALAGIRFHQLVTLMELRRDGRMTTGDIRNPADEYLRFRATRSLSFGVTDISKVDYDEANDRLEIRVNFLGLYGPASPLPPSYTERIIEAETTPGAVEDFLDLFNHRLISLLHVIWRKYRYYLRYERDGADPLSKRFLALCGFPLENRKRIGKISRAAMLPHLGLISLFSNSADVVGATLSNFFGIPCRIKEFIPRQVHIGEESRLALGQANHCLGEDAILGYELADDFGKFRICVGRASFETLADFLPHGDKHAPFSELLMMVTREPLEWDMEFAFEPDTIPMATLGDCRLGWSSWLYSETPDALESTIRLAGKSDITSIDEDAFDGHVAMKGAA